VGAGVERSAGTLIAGMLTALLAVVASHRCHRAASIRRDVFADVFAIVTIALGLGAIAALAVMPALGRGDREAEDAAREYFDRHGRWPDEAERG
jgi:hypothetical protein